MSVVREVPAFLARLLKGEQADRAWYRLPCGFPAPPLDSVVRTFFRTRPPPPEFVRGLIELMGAISYRMFARRLQRGHSCLLVLSDEQRVASYGWLTDMSVYRKYHAISRDGWVLGPYATRPDCRRRGYYARLLRHSIAWLRGIDAREQFIFAEESNTPSRSVIEAVGFEPIGVYRTSIAMLRIRQRSCLLPDRPRTVRSVAAGAAAGPSSR